MTCLVDTTVLSELTRRTPDPRVVARLPAGCRRDALTRSVLTILEPFREGRVVPFDEHAAVELPGVRKDFAGTGVEVVDPWSHGSGAGRDGIDG
jgi:hypothetical protein